MSASNNESVTVELDNILAAQEDYPLEWAEWTDIDRKKQINKQFVEFEQILTQNLAMTQKVLSGSETSQEETMTYAAALRKHFEYIMRSSVLPDEKSALEDFQRKTQANARLFAAQFPPESFPQCLNAPASSSSVPENGNILLALSTQYVNLQEAITAKLNNLNASAPGTSVSNAPALPLTSQGLASSFSLNLPVSPSLSSAPSIPMKRAFNESPAQLPVLNAAVKVNSRAFELVKNDFLQRYAIEEALSGNEKVLMIEVAPPTGNFRQFDNTYKVTESLGYFLGKVNDFTSLAKTAARQRGHQNKNDAAQMSNAKHFLDAVVQVRNEFNDRFPKEVYKEFLSSSQEDHPLNHIVVSLQQIEDLARTEVAAISQPTIVSAEAQSSNARFFLSFEDPAEGPHSSVEPPVSDGLKELDWPEQETDISSDKDKELGVAEPITNLYSAAKNFVRKASSIGGVEEKARYMKEEGFLFFLKGEQHKKAGGNFSSITWAQGTTSGRDKVIQLRAEVPKSGIAGFFGSKASAEICSVRKDSKGAVRIESEPLSNTTDIRVRQIEGTALATGALVAKWQLGRDVKAPAMIINGENLSCDDVLTLMKQFRSQGTEFKLHADLHFALIANTADSALQEYQKFVTGEAGSNGVQIFNPQSARQAVNRQRPDSNQDLLLSTANPVFPSLDSGSSSDDDSISSSPSMPRHNQ